MTNLILRRALGGSTGLAATVIVLVIFGPYASAQTRDVALPGLGMLVEEQPTELPQPKRLSLIRSGYTRPGYPNDTLKGGKVLSLAWDDAYSGRYLGGTVYFAVYERAYFGSGDSFGTGLRGIDELFKEGRSEDGRYSPAFDTNARFLYVYQVVNDRGLDPRVDGDSSMRDFRTEDIVSATVKLLVEPREITSWGHFSKSGFAAGVVDRDLRGKEQEVGNTKNARVLPLALSSNPSVLGALPFQEYLSIAPALSLHGLKNGFGLNFGGLNLRDSTAYKELSDLNKSGTNLLGWQKNVLASANGGMEPNYVQVNWSHSNPMMGGYPFDSNGMPLLLPVGQNNARGYLQVDWNGDQVIKLGAHSVVFGFTSNLPPADEVVRLISTAKVGADGKEAAGTNSMALVDGYGPGVGVGQIVGPGTVPTPVCVGEPLSVGGGNWLDGFGGGGGGGGAMAGAGAFAGGGLVGPRAPYIGGGGGGGGGSQDQNQEQNQNQNQNQKQKQNQHNGHGHGHHSGGDCDPGGNVVPEPASIALGLLGLPALYAIVKRRRGSVDSV